MLDALSKATFSGLAGSVLLKRLASRYGMRHARGFARRFVAGETIEEMVDVVRGIERQGLVVTIDHLGEEVSEHTSALAATHEYCDVLRAVAAAGIGRNLSIKPTQFGLGIDRATCIDNMRRLLEVAVEFDSFVRLDMEDSDYTEETLRTFENLWRLGYTNIGIVIQSYLRRSPEDLRRMVALGARVRLVKGAYSEPREVAYNRMADVDAAFIDLMQELLSTGTYPAIATHDPDLLAAAQTFARDRGIDKATWEFQMLYGIRRDLQRSLAADGHPVRVYVPFGREWFPYFMRRLGERPANVWFVVKSVAREDGAAGDP